MPDDEAKEEWLDENTRAIDKEEVEMLQHFTQTERKDMKKTGKVIREAGKFSITEAFPDSPIYNRGFVIGGMRTKDSSCNTVVKNSKDESKKRYTLLGR